MKNGIEALALLALLMTTAAMVPEKASRASMPMDGGYPVAAPAAGDGGKELPLPATDPLER
jgi:hypothetical protein